MNFDIKKFLIDFGYLASGDEDNSHAVSVAIGKAQEIYGLPVTGEADEMTVRALARTPRCGVSDVHAARDAINRWGLTHLTYAIEATPNGRDLTPDAAAHAITRAFTSWSVICGLTFERVSDSDRANLLVGVGRGRRAGFDGPSGTLAWAELPPSDGHRGQLQMRFDLDENFVVTESATGIRLENVACHEIGHLVGLSHTNVGGSLMLPTYSPRISTPQADDIERARTRYGQPKQVPVPLPPTAPSPGPVKAQVLMGDGSLWQFDNAVKVR